VSSEREKELLKKIEILQAKIDAQELDPEDMFTQMQAMEEEFNDWYDDEHLPERSAIEGFDTSLRYVCVNGWPRYLAFYDLRDAQVLEESGYKAVSGNHFSPWSKRILPRVRGQYRAAGDQVYPGQACAQPCSRLLMLRFRNAGASAQDVVIGGARELFEGKPGVAQVRVFATTTAIPVTSLPWLNPVAPSICRRCNWIDFAVRPRRSI
jgi:hypothetical protein